MSDDLIIGPVQMLVLGFADNEHFTGEILEELQRLKDADLIKLIDLLFVAKQDGDLVVVKATDLSEEEAQEYGAIAGALIGLGAAGEEGAEIMAEAGAEAMSDGHLFDDEDVWYVADTIPEGMSAGIALIEHRWAIPLRNAIVRAGGMALADEWIHAKDLIAVGLAVSDEVAAAH